MSGLDAVANQGALAFTATAVVEADDDGTASLDIVTTKDESTGQDIIIGMKVDCVIVDGPFQGTPVAAQLCAPLGASTPTPPVAGSIVVLVLPGGSPDRGCYAIGSVLGGTGAPIKAAIAGVDVKSPEVLKKMRADAPPKGTGEVKYFRGAPYGIRLKGKSDGFNSEFFLEADDGTNIVLRWDPSKGCYCVKIKDSKGAFVQLADGEIALQSPNGKNGIYVTDEGVKILGVDLEVKSDNLVTVEGAFVGLNLGDVPPAIGVNGVTFGPGGPVNAPSATVFIGRLHAGRSAHH